MAQQPSRTYRFILTLLRLMVRAFFRRVIVIGREHVPESGGGIVVAWHPNGLIDPGLVLTQFPRQIVFGARHGVLRYPLLGLLMRKIGTVAIYRAADLPGLDASHQRDEPGAQPPAPRPGRSTLPRERGRRANPTALAT